MSETLKLAVRSSLRWLLGAWVIGAALWTGWVVSSAFPWDPKDSPFAQVGGLLLLTLILGLPLAIIGSIVMTLLREPIRRVLPPSMHAAATLAVSMALGYEIVAVAEPDSASLHVIGLIAAGVGELVVFMASGARRTGAA